MGLISRVSSRTYRIIDKKFQFKMVNAVSANSRSAVYAKKVVYKRKRWLTTAEKKAAGKSPVVGKPQRHYPTDEARRRFKTTVAGKHRGKRVVFLKQLESGLLLVTGPFKINGVPMRRVNQKYVIPTSTKLDFQLSVPESVDDEYFSRVELKAQSDEGPFQNAKEVYKASDVRKADQKVVDAAIVAAAKKVPHMVNYLGAKFALRNGQAPHTMKF